MHRVRLAVWWRKLFSDDWQEIGQVFILRLKDIDAWICKSAPWLEWELKFQFEHGMKCKWNFDIKLTEKNTILFFHKLSMYVIFMTWKMQSKLDKYIHEPCILYTYINICIYIKIYIYIYNMHGSWNVVFEYALYLVDVLLCRTNGSEKRIEKREVLPKGLSV